MHGRFLLIPLASMAILAGCDSGQKINEQALLDENRDLRSELNPLVSLAHHRTGRPHGWIHNELRRRCGGPPVAAATREQLQERIEAVRVLQRELTA